MKYKVFIDGKEGTTGLKIFDRIKNRDDIELLTISEELRKDIGERKKFINQADVVFLCLPDSAAIEAVSLLENDKTIIIDTSTAHRTDNNWAYGFPELSLGFRNKIENSKKIAVPGCHASGMIAITYPLINKGVISNDYPFVYSSITGYSGGGKKMIADYAENESEEYFSPRQYALTQQHKHLKEVVSVCKMKKSPIFTPIVSNYYAGMSVSFGIYTDMLLKKMTLNDMVDFYKDYYKNSYFISVNKCDDAFLASNVYRETNNMNIQVCGNDERINIVAMFDNLGKGASGAAMQNMNIALKLDEKKGLI